MDILANEEEHSKEAIYITSTGQFFWVFVYLWPIILFLFPQLTSPMTLLGQMCVQLFAKMDPTTEDCGHMSTLLWDGAFPFLTSKELSYTCAERGLL